MNKPILIDQAQRQQALDPTNSFIVQAPAGSGKTELLAQRFLTLLSKVNFPEEILAITFTKKSAAEMRDRIMTALDEAADAKPIESPHKKATRELALNALRQNETHHWNLLENPNRLRIQTIDSFNAWLARRLPTLSCFGASPEVADEPTLLYREAVQEFLSHLDENTAWSDAIEKLLIHLDNDMNKVEYLLIKMLQHRDQWLPYIALNIDNAILRSKLESNLKSIVTDTLITLDQLFPKEHAKELISLAKIAAQNVLRSNPDSPLAFCKSLDSLPGTSIQDLPFWLGLSKLLFTDQLLWRKRFDKKIGFPSSSQAINSEEKTYFKELQERIKNLVEKLLTHNKLRDAFFTLHQAPTPTYQNNQWEILTSLHQTLKVVSAQLKLIFQRYGKIDYIENAHAALHSLGSDDQPTDLALTLDYKLKHILVDEFQDTSNSQFRLIEKLIMGWEQNDGRTLFLVGDPMQSIYRFREAEVGLFIHARENGIKQLPLIPLTLSVNFRSTPNIVDWVNSHFKIILPSHDNIENGAISFCASSANKLNRDHSGVILHPSLDATNQTQAKEMLAIIQFNKENFPQDKIAILVRSRNHLRHIIPLLKKNNLAFQALDIDPLVSRPVVQDLMSLTKALLHSAQRIDWLSVLRAPFCGFLLEDLLALSLNSTNETIWERMQDSTCKLTEDGKLRLARVVPIFKHMLSERRRSSLRHWVESTWQLLGGPACVDQSSDLDDANTFFKLLDKLDVGGDLIHFNDLDKAIEKLYATPNVESNQTLQIMTIHNAKGLEFDTVILPHLESRTPYDEQSLLLWMERSIKNQRQLIMGPIQAAGDKSDPIYDYIKSQQDIKSDFENGRLLYVAATRAKKQLHLLFSLQTKENSEKLLPPANSLLEKLWPAIEETLAEEFKNKPSPILINSNPDINKKLFRRLPTHWTNHYKQPDQATTLHQKSPGFYLAANDSKYVGTLIHKIIENICLLGSDWWKSLKQKDYIEKQLLQMGMLKESVFSSVTTVMQAIENTLADPRGQWIIKPHQEAKTEWALTVDINGLPKQCVIDRTFIDETGTRWIIDYKSTSCHDIFLLDSFLAEEYNKHESQLKDYHLAVKAMDDNAYPIKLGLYYPLIPAWYEVKP